MSRRDEALIETYEDVKDWLEAYKHTITDEAVLRVIEVLEGNCSEEWDDLQNQISCKEDQIRELDYINKELKEKVKELEAEILEIKSEYLATALKETEQ